MTKRMLVCGGRDFSSHLMMKRWLDAVVEKYSINVLVHGGATGADSMAGEWAKSRGLAVEEHKANWLKYGRSAGPRRNLAMLATLQPGDIVVAFPGGRGTKHMTEAAAKRPDIRTIIVSGDP